MSNWWTELADQHRADPAGVEPETRRWWDELAAKHNTGLTDLDAQDRAVVEKANEDRLAKLARGEIAPPGTVNIHWRPSGRSATN